MLLTFGSAAQIETEPNDNGVSSDTTSEGVMFSGSMSNSDLNDYFFTVLPDDGTVKLKFTTTGTDPGNNTDMQVYVYNKAFSQIGFFSRNNLSNGTSYTDSIMVYCRAADTIYFRFFQFAGTGSLNYNATYTLEVPGPNDAEPNNDFSSANSIIENNTYSGRLGHTSISTDIDDRYITVLPDDGSTVLKFNYRATNGSPTTDMQVYVYNKNFSQIGFFSQNNLVPDSTYSDSLTVYCRAADTVYFRFYVFNGTGCMAYDFSYTQKVEGNADPEPNDNATMASPVMEGNQYSGRLGYTSVSQDIVDYYYSVLPDDGTLTLKFDYTATNNTATTDMRVRVLNKNLGQIGNYSRNNLMPDSTYSDSIVVYCRAADTVYFEFYNFAASGCHIYDFEYDLFVPGPNDPEPNDVLSDASEVLEGINYQGRLGYTSINQDVIDNYYTVLPDDGTLSLIFNYTAQINTPTTDMRVRVLNKNGGQIGIFSGNNLQPFTTYTDTLMVYCRAADTVYFEFYNFSGSGCHVYDFEYIQTVPGPNDTEPNDNTSLAQTVVEDVNYNGRLGYVSIAQDINDYYITELQQDGTVKLKFSYTATNDLATTDMRVRVLNESFGQIGLFARNNLLPDSTYTDSIMVYCRAADTIYFEFFNFSGSGCHIYNFEYNIIPPGFANDIEPNNNFAEAQPQSIGDTVTGHVGYLGGSGDIRDYFLFVLPDDGTVTLNLEYRSNSDGNFADLFHYLYSSDKAQRQFSSYPNLEPDSLYSVSITQYCLAKDTFYFQMHALSGCFDYRITTEFTPASGGTDEEPNNSFANAQQIELTDTTYGANGHIGNGVDGSDYFTFYNSGYSEIDLIYNFKRTGNPINQNGVFQVKLYDENKNQIGLRQYLNSVANDSLVTDTFSLDCPPLDTFYVSFSSALSCIGYNIRFDVVNGTFYKDSDNDNFGDSDSSIYSCTGPPPGYIATADDCDDNNPNVNPNAIEICDGLDNNCDGNIDEGIYTTSNTNTAICDGDSILVGGVYRFIAGVYTDTTIIVNGCDSISVVTVSVNPTHVMGTTTTTSDPGQAGIFSNSFSNQFGCDSTYIDTIVYVAPPCPTTDSTTITMVTCDANMAGMSSVTLQGSDGCDSVVTTIKLYDAGSTTSLPSVSVCDGDSALIFGSYQSLAGSYQAILNNQNGCDSIIEQELIVNPSYTMILPASTICAGDSLLIFGNYQNTAGNYSFTYQTATGCDSTVSKQLFVESVINTNENLSICNGDSVLIFGLYQTQAGSYMQTYQNSSGCDSVHTVSVTVLPNISVSTSVMICDGDSILLGGTYQTTAGVYTDIFNAANGCDSIVNTGLSIKPAVTITVQDSICPGDSLFVGGAYQTNAGTYSDVYSGANGCDSTVVTTLTIRTDSGCGNNPTPQPCLSIVSDNSWSQSTVISPSNFSGTWNGAAALPPVSTFTNAVTIGQPYGYASINAIENTEVISVGHSITYLRKEFSIANANNVNVRILTTVDDQADIYLNGQRVALITQFGSKNFKFPAHDIKYNSDGTTSNGHLSGDVFDVTTPNLNGVLQNGTNELIVAVRNLGKASDKGGLSFRMDINCNDNNITKKDAIADLKDNLILFPNPVTDVITISSNLAINEVKVHDLNGKLLSQKTYNAEKEVRLDMEDLPKGVYMITVLELGGETSVEKIVKN
jgi:hypothetical protein